MATIKIKQTKSRIGAPKDQKRTLDALGLKKMNQVVEREDTPVVMGMVRKVHHWCHSFKKAYRSWSRFRNGRYVNPRSQGC